MLKILFVEDDVDSIRLVRKLIKDREIAETEVSGFEEAENRIVEYRPDIVILDIFNGLPAEGVARGLRTRKFIWNRHFCPIVVYSAEPDVHDNKHEPHPFVEGVKKGAGSPKKVLAVLDKFRPHIDALNKAEESIRNSFFYAMRDVAPYAHQAFSDDDKKRLETIIRSGRRRLAALMDEPLEDTGHLASWEQYLFPPISEHILLGDILREKEGSADEPASFRVVLTPSCDLAVSGNAPNPKVGKSFGCKMLFN